MVATPDSQDDHPEADLERVNNLLAEWAARSATTSAALIDRLEAMGYAVRGKSEDEIADVLHQPPTGRPQTSSR
ncbi:hypothetical protein [Methylobacterium sp. PvR107]|uniref:hypothetical protein n=1 Tax=Methylobacterium sp. PvR107 TaxID=2806597 RepID=UPI001AE117CF|nr:hypothetical protein [Methylobacterium sp. PvR107]